MITFQREPIDPYWQDVQPLFQKHYEEITENTDKIKLDVNMELYYAMYKANKLVVHTVRQDGILIGYGMWFLHHHMHYKQRLTASSDTIFLLPESRKGLLGYKFLKWSIEDIKKENPQRIMMQVTPKLDFSHLLKRLGANKLADLYSFILD